MLNISCFKCSSKKYFLQRKGHNVGAYCSNCGSWVKWVGKADVKKWLVRGNKVLEEGCSPAKPAFEQVAVEKGFVGVSCGVNGGSEGSGGRGGREGSGGREGHESRGRGAFKINPFDKRIRGDKKDKESFERSISCDVCNHGELPLIRGSEVTSEVKIVVYDGVLSVYDKETGVSLGDFKLSYCPGCGVKLL